jgi:hypothetical protein
VTVLTREECDTNRLSHALWAVWKISGQHLREVSASRHQSFPARQRKPEGQRCAVWPFWGSASKIHTGKFDNAPPSMISDGSGSTGSHRAGESPVAWQR